LNARDQPPAEVSDQRVSGLTGAVHRFESCPRYRRNGPRRRLRGPFSWAGTLLGTCA
ncbi:phospholipase, partial [Mycobacterium tuberculosis]